MGGRQGGLSQGWATKALPLPGGDDVFDVHVCKPVGFDDIVEIIAHGVAGNGFQLTAVFRKLLLQSAFLVPKFCQPNRKPTLKKWDIPE